MSRTLFRPSRTLTTRTLNTRTLNTRPAASTVLLGLGTVATVFALAGCALPAPAAGGPASLHALASGQGASPDEDRSTAATSSTSTGTTPTGTTPTGTTPTGATQGPGGPPASSSPGAGTALAAVAGLTVKGRAPKTGYTRAQFGQTWFDADRNGCDTRNDILRRDLRTRTMKNACKVLAGTLSPDPYTGRTIRFEYGGPSELDIDHVVALSDAWQKGAAQWPAGKRLALANDPLNLLAVDSATNRSKGDGDTATWLPPYRAYRCAYVARQVAVKGKYGIWVTAAEKTAMSRVLSGCPALGLPPPGPAPTVAALPRSSGSSSTTTTSATATTAPKAAPGGSDPAEPAVRENVHPGAYCSPHGALGRTAKGTPMRCTTTAGDSRARWRSA